MGRAEPCRLDRVLRDGHRLCADHPGCGGAMRSSRVRGRRNPVGGGDAGMGGGDPVARLMASRRSPSCRAAIRCTTTRTLRYKHRAGRGLSWRCIPQPARDADRVHCARRAIAGRRAARQFGAAFPAGGGDQHIVSGPPVRSLYRVGPRAGGRGRRWRWSGPGVWARGRTKGWSTRVTARRCRWHPKVPIRRAGGDRCSCCLLTACISDRCCSAMHFCGPSRRTGHRSPICSQNPGP